MNPIGVFMLFIGIAIVFIPLVSVERKGIVALATVIGIAMVSSIPAIASLTGNPFEYVLQGSQITGRIPVRIDALSGWFILVLNFTFITGAWYGLQYMKAYRQQREMLSLHAISYILVFAGLIAISALQHSMAFLIAWEIMALSSFFLIIFERHRAEVIKAGINYLIQSHVCIILLTLGFIWVAMNENSYDFNAIAQFTEKRPSSVGLALFLCLFSGFAIKAGFVPFHTWLPYAHPAAPAHVSGVMSGVIIKIGIYGILRMLLLVRTDFLVLGYILLFLSVLTGIYGVMLAIIQHNLKKLLAYHSIENIGIIGMAIGLGCIGIGKGNPGLVALGFSGALLHTLNHSLFKSLLFYAAGHVYQATHTMDIEKLGGLVKKMPHTTLLFLVASLAICGLPPFNGFVSEFLIYTGMFRALPGSDFALLSLLVLGFFGLALIGGLAMFCFTKAVGTVFLGSPRHPFAHDPGEAGWAKLMPMYVIVVLLLGIGLFPGVFVSLLSKPVELYSFISSGNGLPGIFPAVETLSGIGWGAAIFLVLAGLIFWLRTRWVMNRVQTYDQTWACGYEGHTGKMQYTASSFVRAYRKLVEPVLSIHKKKKEITGIFPVTAGQETHPGDKIEEWFIDLPVKGLKKFFNRFIFLQNGNLQFYILYGVVFITLVLVLPLVIEYFSALIQFLNSI